MAKDQSAPETRVRAYFDEVAGEWDRLREEFYDERIAELVVERAAIGKGDVVLDVGCGTGFLMLAAARKLGGQGTIIGLDLSRQMLKRARENLRSRGFKTVVEFSAGEAQDIPFGDASVRAVVGNMVLHHCPDPKKAIVEMARVLRPRGRLVLSDLEKHHETWLREEAADLWLGFDLRKCEKMFREAKLVNVKVELTRSRCCGVSIGGRRSEIGIFLAEGGKRP